MRRFNKKLDDALKNICPECGKYGCTECKQNKQIKYQNLNIPDMDGEFKFDQFQKPSTIESL
jgi:hypothetical protein